MAEMTEVHPGVETKVDPLSLIRECIPNRPLVPVVNALVRGMDKHGPWDMTEEREDYVAHLRNHFEALSSGECYDKEDGQHHAASIVLRGLQILDLDYSMG